MHKGRMVLRVGPPVLAVPLLLVLLAICAPLGNAQPVLPPTAPPSPSTGFQTPYVELEAEDATTNGVVIGFNTTFTSLASEASQRRAVTLANASQWVQFVSPVATNSIVIRYSIPDSPNGQGLSTTLKITVVNHPPPNVFTVTLTSRYTWLYGNWPYTNSPADGNAHYFYDEVNFGFPFTVIAKTQLKLQPSTSDVPITIDLVDVYGLVFPLMQPSNSISIVQNGADPSGNKDSTNAIIATINQAKASLTGMRTVWIPSGTFTVTSHIDVGSGITLAGSGPWSSILRGSGVGVFGFGSGIVFKDFAIYGEIVRRNDTESTEGIGGTLSNSVVSNVLVTHTKVGMWFNGPLSNLTITNCTIRNTVADGINFHSGLKDSVVQYTQVRNTGDDGLAMWSWPFANTGNVFRNNVVQLPELANNIAVYGGANNSVLSNYVAETLMNGGGLHVGQRFGSTSLSGITTIANNRAERTGSLDQNWRFGVGALWFYASDSSMTGTVVVTNNTLSRSVYEAVQFISDGQNTGVYNVSLSSNNVYSPGTFVLQIQCKGAAVVSNLFANFTSAPKFGQYACGHPFVLTDGGGNGNWINLPTTCSFN